MTDIQPSMPAVAAMVHHCCCLLRPRLAGCESCSGLVVGCGTGDEAIFMERALDCRRVLGLDIEQRFSSLARASGRVLLADAESLPFARQSFDFAAAYHSLEHVRNPSRVLDEVQRVLKPGGWFYVGVPNRTRLVGYLGSFDANPWQKVWWNIKAWRWRIQGRFRNELGAHAGFDQYELAGLLKDRFSAVELLTAEYLRFKYAGRIPRPVLDLLLSPALFNYSVASHYALCQRAE